MMEHILFVNTLALAGNAKNGIMDLVSILALKPDIFWL
jgi:hypothetical protein